MPVYFETSSRSKPRPMMKWWRSCGNLKRAALVVSSDERLAANIARWVGNQILPAELLTVNPTGITLTQMNQ